eukprot:764551-Hanusia_phi.AAC.1
MYGLECTRQFQLSLIRSDRLAIRTQADRMAIRSLRIPPSKLRWPGLVSLTVLPVHSVPGWHGTMYS